MMTAVERFQAILVERGLSGRVRHLDENTRTAKLAARALGTPLGAIVKSLVVIVDDRPALALVSGDRRANLSVVARHFDGVAAAMARGGCVKAITGFAIGGIPPFAPGEDGAPLPTIIDRHLFRFPIVWAAAGSPYAVFPIAPDELEKASNARVADFTDAVAP